MSIFSKNKDTVIAGAALLLVFANGANDVAYGSEKNEFCDQVGAELTAELEESGLLKSLEDVDGNGQITVSMSYRAGDSEVKQLPIVGSHNCGDGRAYIDLSNG